jgi:cytochrome c-type biogenesis protein
MVGMEISYLAAVGAGVLSFLSPCVLPIVPAYICFVAGTSLDQISGPQAVDRALLRRVTFAAVAFVLGFSTVFVVMGASAAAINRLLISHIDVIAQVAGAVIVLFGLHFMGVFRFGWLNRDVRFDVATKPTSLLGAYVIGLAFAFGWTPCIGPILATILTVAASDESLLFGVSLLGIYALGLGLPFIAAAMAINPFMRFLGRFNRHVNAVKVATGGVLVLAGVMVFTNSMSQMGFYLIEMFPALGQIG